MGKVPYLSYTPHPVRLDCNIISNDVGVAAQPLFCATSYSAIQFCPSTAMGCLNVTIAG